MRNLPERALSGFGVEPQGLRALNANLTGVSMCELQLGTSQSKIIRRIHIAQHINLRDTRPFQAFNAVCKGMFGGPPDISQEPSRHPDARVPYQPIAPVRRRAKHRIMRPQHPKGARDMRLANARNIATDDADGSRRQASHQAHHPIAKISAPLWDARHMRGPNP